MIRASQHVIVPHPKRPGAWALRARTNGDWRLHPVTGRVRAYAAVGRAAFAASYLHRACM